MKMDLPTYDVAGASVSFRDALIPSHWKILRLRFLMKSQLRNGLFKKAEFWGEGTPIVNVGDVFVHDEVVNLDELDRVVCTDTELLTYRVEHGDVFFVRSSLKLEGIGKPGIILNPVEPTVFECHLVSGKPDTRKVDPQFLIRFLNTAESRCFIVACAKTATMTTIEQGRIKDLVIVCPPVPEQKQIVTFLDLETAKIDRLLEVRRKQVERLQEQRTAVIHHSITKGLDPYAKWKPSGHPWLEDIPAHWDTIRLKFLSKINPSKTNSGHTSFDVDQVVFLPMECVSTDGKVDQSNRERICDLWKGFTYFAKGDVLVAKITPCFENGKGALVSELETDVGFGTTEFHVIRAGKKLLNQFLYLITASYRFRCIGERFMTGAAGQQRVSEQFIKDFPISLPPLDEQEAIVNHVNIETKKMDNLVNKYKRELDLLTEYRASLISHAVTGKINVCGLVAPVQTENL
jgi:type I restriction enzyme S subunit